ncbi:hypothetical protein D0U02_20275 [Burkholderia pseudomallei]|nr:hypothetical protein D0U02_20275 [Burkholderia pseudomallei]RFS59887.1 hypothetical protein D0U05_07055 [Burkholderia pseudomallei]RFS67221.1 hypothetical protein D0U01_12620 [Burkholderia pseudomallei]RFS71414.1 hypothetical protein D0T98_24150 [Burkholderia pseudomallei]
MGADDVAHIVGSRLDTPDLPHRRLALLDRERIRGGGRRRRGRFRMTDDGVRMSAARSNGRRQLR